MLMRLFRHYDKVVWVRFIGQVVTSVGNFLIGPFITIYLHKYMHIGLYTTMLVVSISPVVGLLSSVFAGKIADRFGRKQVMVLSLAGFALSMVLYGLSRTALEFAVATIVEGVANALYFPASDAHIADTVAEEHRPEVYSLIHMGLNIGAAVGPLIGVGLFLAKPHLLFYIAACSFVLTGLLFLFTIPSHHVEQRSVTSEPSHRQHREFHVTAMKQYWTVLLLTLFALPIYFLYTQVQTNFPLHLSQHFTNYTHIYAIMMTFNGTLVIALQMVVARITKRFQSWKLITLSFVAFALVGFGYAWAPSLGVLLVTEFIFTVGEMVGFPQMRHVVSVIAPVEKRGVYFAIFNSGWAVAGMIGPLFGAAIAKYAGGAVLFSGLGVAIALGGVFAVLMIRKISREEVTSEIEA